MGKMLSLISIPIMGILTVIVALIFGVILFLTAQHITYLIIFSPLLIGGAAGFVLHLAARWTHFRVSALALLFGIVGGLLMFATYHYAEYLQFKQDIGDEIRAEYIIPEEEEAQVIDEVTQIFLEEETGRTGVLGFMQLQANEGLSITSTRNSGGGGRNLGTTGFYIYTGIEALILVGAMGLLLFSQTSNPYCEDGNKWLKMNVRGYVAQENAENFVQHMNNKQLTQAAALIETTAPPKPHLKINMGRCESFSPSGYLEITGENGDKSKNILYQEIPSDHYDILGDGRS